MFTGIVEEVGRIRERDRFCLNIEARQSLEGLHSGDSISVNGTCLTVTNMNNDSFSVEVTPETLRRTNLGSLKEGDPVNLERAVSLGQRMGGHIVQGHIDGTAEIVSMKKDGNSILLKIKATPNIMRYVVEKGFIAIDGVSFTVVSHNDTSFMLSLIPHTRDNTTLGHKRPGDLVNIEIDIIGKYVERLLASYRT